MIVYWQSISYSTHTYTNHIIYDKNIVSNQKILETITKYTNLIQINFVFYDIELCKTLHLI